MDTNRDECAQKLVDAMPPLTEAQREALGLLLAGKRKKVRRDHP